MWSHFEGKARSLQESVDYLATLHWADWKPQGITLHNTAAPTLAQWAETGPNHDARIRNLESYYENELGWHAGPHWFISRTRINWFSNPLLPGVHSRCWNATRFGIEMVGDYGREPFDSGDGASVRDLAVAWIAALNKKFGFNPADLTFHKECTRDNHDCPGRLVSKPDVIARVRAAMAGVAPPIPVAPPSPPPPIETHANVTHENIEATVFGDEMGAYGEIDLDDDGVALPYSFQGDPPEVIVTNRANGKSQRAWVVDKGPWNWTDHAYVMGTARPKCEAQRVAGERADNRRIPTNNAGIDLLPVTAEALGIDGKGIVDWRFA